MSATLVYVTRSDDRFLLRARQAGEESRTEVLLRDRDALVDLLRQVRGGHGGAERLGRRLGELLYAGEVGDRIRDGQRLDQGPLCLHTDESCAGWPWELAADPKGGKRPALDGTGFIRIAGPPREARPVPARGVLAVPSLAGGPRLDALVATTRRLDRKTAIDILPADPVTGPGLRRALAAGAALVHVEGIGEDERVVLDDGPVPADRLGINAGCWLVVLGGTECNTAAGRRLREQGAALVLAHQAELPLHQSAAIERELYRALAEGSSVLDALARVRQALAAGEGAGGGHSSNAAWAAPVLWVGPAVNGDGRAALMPFPPPLTVLSRATAAAAAAAVEPGESAGGALGHPIPAPVFVQETVRGMLAGDTAELAARSAVMHALAGDVTVDANAEVDASLSAAERTARLADRLIDAIGQRDVPWRRPADWRERLAQVAELCAVDPASVERAARACAGAPVVCLIGPDAARLARAFGERVFDQYPVTVHAEAEGALIGGPRRGAEHALTAGGWLYRVAALNWRRDQLDPLRPDQPQPRTRMPIVAARPDGRGYRIYDGAWLVVEGAERVEPGTLAAAAAAVEAGVLTGLNADGAWYRLPVPASFRLVLTAPHPLAGLPAQVPQLTVNPAADAEITRARWLAEVTRRLGPAPDEAAARHRRALADRLAPVIDAIRFVLPVASDAAAAVLTDAVLSERDDGIDGSLLMLQSSLQSLPYERYAVVAAALSGQRDALFEAVAEAARVGDVHPALTLAGALGRDEAITLAHDPERLAARVRDWRSTAKLALPDPRDSQRLLRCLTFERYF